MKKPILVGVSLLLSGCAVHMDPVVTGRPALPEIWGTIRTEQLVGQCPAISGVFEQIPTVMQLGRDNQWGQPFTGGKWDHVRLLSPPEPVQRKPDRLQLEEDQMSIEQSDPSRWVLIAMHKSDPGIELRSEYRAESGDFSCQGGEMKLPDYRFEGAGEGVTHNDLILYSLFVTTAGDIVIYEQRHRGRKSVTHSYYRFSRV